MSDFKFYLAPMQEVTGFVYRKTYAKLYNDVDKYFSPFIVPTQKKVLKTKEKRDISPENNKGIFLVPQILTNDSDKFIELAKYLHDMGYDEVNINLGCPAATMVSKKRGSGFLEDVTALDRFFDGIFNAVDTCGNVGISVKTRLGIESENEFFDILEVYNRYPLKELIIHPRVQKDFYNNKPRVGLFAGFMSECKHKLCYNGDIFTKKDFDEISAQLSGIDTYMLGRGLVANPALIREINGGEPLSPEELRLYHDMLFDGYLAAMGNETDALFKLKEVWQYMSRLFVDCSRELKKVNKARTADEYRVAVARLFAECELG